MWTPRREARRTRRSQAGLTLVELLVSIIVVGILTTMLVSGWINLQRASAVTVSASTSRATARDAMSRVSSELRGAQPTSLPTPVPSATGAPVSQPPLTMATRNDVRFSSSFNSSNANADGSGLAALRPTRLWLDTSGSQDQKTLFWQRDMNANGSFTDAGDRSIVLAEDVVNEVVADATNGGTSYTPVFRYAYRNALGNIQWTDNADSVLASIVAIRARLLIDSNMARGPSPVDITTTVRLRNASTN